jgi:hypothetical protein
MSMGSGNKAIWIPFMIILFYCPEISAMLMYFFMDMKLMKDGTHRNNSSSPSPRYPSNM